MAENGNSDMSQHADGGDHSGDGRERPSLAQVIEDIETLTGQLDAGRALLAGGEFIELDGLQQEVDRVCTAARHVTDPEMPSDSGPRRTLSDGLGRMMAAIDALSAEMRTAQARMTDQMGGIARRQQAVTAYGKAPRSKPGS